MCRGKGVHMCTAASSSGLLVAPNGAGVGVGVGRCAGGFTVKGPDHRGLESRGKVSDFAAS